MTGLKPARGFLSAVFFGLLASGASAQTGGVEYKPEVGQEGKDVVWVPTPQSMVEKMLDMARVTPKDFVMDLGSGDGRTVITAAKRGARALGVEYNPEMVELSRRNAAKEGVTDRAQFVKADLFETDLSKASVITMFLLPDINLKLRPAILNLRPGTRVVSNSFTMGEWRADRTEQVKEDCTTYCTALLWIVPAKAGGVWQVGEGELTIKQEFQMITGTLAAGGADTPIKGRLRGERITFTAGKSQYTGRVTGDTIVEGVVKTAGNHAKWTATRK
ncbi:MAG: class I SAM-dependent methyltransferase [Burkholderiales bacterium]|nr:class I SAM-dependent methyltransferase [Burkholderiales bacterium]